MIYDTVFSLSKLLNLFKKEVKKAHYKKIDYRDWYKLSNTITLRDIPIQINCICDKDNTSLYKFQITTYDSNLWYQSREYEFSYNDMSFGAFLQEKVLPSASTLDVEYETSVKTILNTSNQINSFYNFFDEKPSSPEKNALNPARERANSSYYSTVITKPTYDSKDLYLIVNAATYVLDSNAFPNFSEWLKDRYFVSPLNENNIYAKIATGDTVKINPDNGDISICIDDNITTYMSLPVCATNTTAPLNETITIGETKAYPLIDDIASVQQSIESLAEKVENLTKKEEKEEEKNMFNFNFDFGSCKDNHKIRMSAYGLAVQNSEGKWVAYDTTNNTIMDVDIFNFEGSDYFWKIPVALNAVKVGDVIIHNRYPKYVTAVNDNQKFTVIDPAAGEEQVVLAAHSPFGFNFITKVVSFFDMANGGNVVAPSEENPFGNMLPFFMMQSNGDESIDPMLLMFMMNGNQDMMMNPMTFAVMAMMGNKNDGKTDDFFKAMMLSNMMQR